MMRSMSNPYFAIVIIIILFVFLVAINDSQSSSTRAIMTQTYPSSSSHFRSLQSFGVSSSLLGFSMAIHCSTKVLKLICFFLWAADDCRVLRPVVLAPVLELESCEYVERIWAGEKYPSTLDLLWLVAMPEQDPGGSIRGGESLRKAR